MINRFRAARVISRIAEVKHRPQPAVKAAQKSGRKVGRTIGRRRRATTVGQALRPSPSSNAVCAVHWMMFPVCTAARASRRSLLVWDRRDACPTGWLSFSRALK